LDSPFIEKGYIGYTTLRYDKLEVWESAQTGILRFMGEMLVYINGRYWL